MKHGNFRTFFILSAMMALLAMMAIAQPAGQGKDDKSVAIKAQMDIAKTAERKSDFQAALDAYHRILEIDPHNYTAHMAIINFGKNSLIKQYQEKPGFGSDEKVMKELSEKLTAESETKNAKYEKLAKENPTKAVYQLILANMNQYEPVKMQEYLYKAQQLEPNSIDVLRMLAQFEKLKGNNVTAYELYKKISDLDPQDENAAFSYYYSLSDVDYKQFKVKTEEFIKRFPGSERGAVLYSQIASKGNASERVAYLEKLRIAYPPEKNQNSMSEMTDLFTIYLHSSPDKALTFAQEMIALASENGKKEWQSLIDFLTNYKQAESLIKDNKSAEALQILEKTKLPSRSSATMEATIRFNLLKAAAQTANGQTEAAYEGLKVFYIKSPSDQVRSEMTKIGKKLGKKDGQIENDIQSAIAALSQPFKDFSLGLYDQNKNVSLADYRGKVVLLNFWYPLCGPCHAEAPYIQKLVEKFGKDKFVVLAPNAFPNQDSMVMPFFKGNKYDFIPLKVPDSDYLRNEYQIRGYPTNYLIDKKGNRVYETGNVTPERLRQIEIQIEMLLAQK